MNITFLGTSHGVPSAERYCSCTMIEVGGATYFIDCGAPLTEPADGLTLDQTHVAALAYACDYTIIEPTLRVLDRPWTEPGLVTASLDHAMWFHRPARVDGWLLYAQEAVSAQDGRGLGLGRFLTPAGDLVATVCQEAAIRPQR